MLSKDEYCILISLCPKSSLAQYFDSSNLTKKKNYNRIGCVLDAALDGYAKNGGPFDKNDEFKKTDGTTGFKHVTEFPCIKQPAGTCWKYALEAIIKMYYYIFLFHN